MMSKSVTFLFIFPFLCACSLKMHRIERTLQTYDTALRVSASVSAEPLTIGELAQVTVTVKNTLTRAVRACTGPNTSYVFIAQPTIVRENRPPVSRDQTIVDHPRCERRLNLEAGEETTLLHPITIPDIGSGRAVLHVSLHVVAPNDCDQLYGCYGTMISASAVPIELRR